jgi:hypothetical protein
VLVSFVNLLFNLAVSVERCHSFQPMISNCSDKNCLTSDARGRLILGDRGAMLELHVT